MSVKRVLMLIGGKYHAWEQCAAIFKESLESTGRYRLDVSDNRDLLKAENIAKYHALVVYAQGGELSRAQLNGLLSFVRGGGMFLGLHSAATCWQNHAEYVEMLGGTFATHGPILEFPVTIENRNSAITARMPDFRIKDELYILDKFDPASVELLATAMWRGRRHPIAYTKTYGKGKVAYIALGHDESVFRHAEFKKIAIRALDWGLGVKTRKTLKAGVIGYGPSFNMGRLHLGAMRDSAGFETCAVCDIDPARRAAALEEQPGIEVYSSTRQMLNKSDVELLVVITPHNTHARLAVDCLSAGRHVIVEKPFCITVNEADTMINAARKNGVMLSVFHNRRWDGDYLTIRDSIRNGLLGEVFHIEVTMSAYGHPRYWWRSDKKISGGAFYDWGAHVCDWVLGIVPAKMTEIAGFFQQDRVWRDVTNEDHCNAVVRFDNGCVANIELSHIAALPKKRWRILGTNGALESASEKEPMSFHMVTYKEGMKLDAEVLARPTEWKAYYENIGDHLLMGEPLVVTPESARRVIALIETAEKSSKSGRALAPPRHCA